MNQLLSELRRRNVFRVAAAYLVVGWLVMQVVATIGGAAGLPDWADSLALVLLVTGFPIVLFIAWAFELTPDGMKKTDASDGPAGFKPLGPSDYVLIAAVLVVLGVVGFQFTGDSPEQNIATTAVLVSTPPSEAETFSEPVSDASIAVLPFADLSPDGDQQYLGDGLAEELLNSLAQHPDLRVAARTSAFSFRGNDVDLRDVGEALSVAHILEGSVQRSGDRVRITVQLIRVEDGFHLWSERFDREIGDVFALQDEIVAAISQTLQIRLGIGAGTGRADGQGIDPRAYDLYLRGLTLWATRDRPSQNRIDALNAFVQASQLAPDFADAWAAIGLVGALSHPAVLDESPAVFLRRSQMALTRAFELDPANPVAHAAAAAWYSKSEVDVSRAGIHARLALELSPNSALTHYARAQYFLMIGDVLAASAAYDMALSLDPLNGTISRTRAEYYLMSGRTVSALEYYDSCLEMTCLADGYEFLGLVAMIIHGDAGRIAAWRERLEPALEALYAAPENELDSDSLLFRAFYQLTMDGASPDIVQQALAGVDLDDISNGLSLVILPSIAESMDSESVFAILQGAYDSGSLFSISLSQAAFSERGAFPEYILRDPQYQAFWAQPGLAEIAAARRANGMTTGLPLPIEAAE